MDGQKKSNEYVSIFKRKHLFPVFVFLPDFWIVDKGVVGEFGGVFFWLFIILMREPVRKDCEEY